MGLAQGLYNSGQIGSNPSSAYSNFLSSSGASTPIEGKATFSGSGSGFQDFARMAPMLGAGLGQAAATLWGDSGSAPQQRVNLSAGGKKLEANIFNAIQNNGIPFNLASRYIGQAKKIAQTRNRANRNVLSKYAAGNVSGVTSGRGLTALLASSSQRLAGAGAGETALYNARRGQYANTQGNLLSFRNQQLQTPILAAQNQAASREYDQLIGARKGAALGSLAELAGASYFYA